MRLAAHGYTLVDIRHLAITHTHPDHHDLAARIIAESGGRLYSHRHNLALPADDQAEAGQRGAYYAQVIQQAGVPLSFLVRHFGFRSATKSLVQKSGRASNGHQISLLVTGILDLDMWYNYMV